MAAGSAGRVISINVGPIRTLEWLGRMVSTAIWKYAHEGPIKATRDGLTGDQQADHAVHGGADKAVYAYAIEDLRWWAAELRLPMTPGSMGENLTVEGVRLNHAVVGEQWSVGSAILEVSQPRIPCFKLGLRMSDQLFPQRFAKAGRPGAYLRVVEEGAMTAGDPIVVLTRPRGSLSVGSIERAYHLRRTPTIARFLTTPGLPESWRTFAERRLDRRATEGDITADMPSPSDS